MSSDRRRRWVYLAGLVLVLAALALAWRYTPLSDFADPAVGSRWLAGLRGTSWAPLLVIGIYSVCGLLMFPVTVLIAATAIAFGPWTGFLYATSGSLISAMLGFWLARLAGPDVVRKVAGRKAAKVSHKLAQNGIVAVASLRMLPVAPFTAINLMAGASGVSTRDFFVGSVLGMAPGIALMTALGHRLEQLWREPTWGNIAIFVLLLLVWFGLAVGLQRWIGNGGPERRALGETG